MRCPHYISLVVEFRPMMQFILGLRTCQQDLVSILSKEAPVVKCKCLKAKKDLYMQRVCISNNDNGFSLKINFIFIIGLKLKWGGGTAKTPADIYQKMRFTRIRMISSGFLSSTGIPFTSFNSSPA